MHASTDLIHEFSNLNHRCGQDLGGRIPRDVGSRIITETADAAKCFHRLRKRALPIGVGVEAILVQEAQVSLRYTQWRSYVVDEQIECLLGVDFGHMLCWHTGCLLSNVGGCLHAVRYEPCRHYQVS